jgi:hypothetical protein
MSFKMMNKFNSEPLINLILKRGEARGLEVWSTSKGRRGYMGLLGSDKDLEHLVPTMTPAGPIYKKGTWRKMLGMAFQRVRVSLP